MYVNTTKQYNSWTAKIKEESYHAEIIEGISCKTSLLILQLSYSLAPIPPPFHISKHLSYLSASLSSPCVSCKDGLCKLTGRGGGAV
jgi:hypothetical protein